MGAYICCVAPFTSEVAGIGWVDSNENRRWSRFTAPDLAPAMHM